jgi:thiamine pyrophosphokinase
LLGIVFTGGAGPALETIRRLFAGPAQGALTAAADSGLALAEAAGIAPGWIIGDMDSLVAPERLNAYPAGRVIRHRSDKDYTDTELALSLLWEQGCAELWILGGGGGRIDHLFAIRALFERERFPRRWITDAADIYCVEAPAVCSLSLEPEGLVSAFPLGEGPWKAASKGLRWPLDTVSWNRGFFGLSNIALQGACTIQAKQGRFMVIIPG